jgi:hypothetical protein
MERLGIVIPYRNRSDHLFQIVPHLARYFSRHQIDSEIPVQIAVIEQPTGLPFNRGLLCNIGFKVLCDAVDYVCFHDVDYLPMWADYRWPELPTMIIWYGFESRPINPARPQARIVHKLEESFSAVVLFQNAQFQRVNGFSTCYWGWGYEDSDLRMRMKQVGYTSHHRRGTFTALDHVNEGFFDVQKPTAAHTRNQALLSSRWTAEQPNYDWLNEGLCRTEFGIGKRWPIRLPPDTRSDIQAEHILINLPDNIKLDGK